MLSETYQWGRNTDGHQSRSPLSAQSGGPVASGSEGSNFILASATSDWLSTRDDTRWNGDTKGSHDPCPDSFRVPTEAEWQTEFAAWSTNNAAGAFSSPLKLTTAGRRHPSLGSLEHLSEGYYWSSTANSNPGYGAASILMFSSSSASFNLNFSRTYGMPVRCIYDSN